MPGGQLPTTLAGFEAAFREALPEGTLAYYAGAAADEITLGRNVEAWRELLLRPRVMVDVSNRDPSVDLFDRRYGLPIAVAPTAYHRLAHPDGEEATARGAVAAEKSEELVLIVKVNRGETKLLAPLLKDFQIVLGFLGSTANVARSEHQPGDPVIWKFLSKLLNPGEG